MERKRHHQRGKMTFYPDLDEEIDLLHSVIEKQEVTEIRPHKQQSKHPAAVTSQKDGTKSKTDAPKHRQENQDRLSDETEHTTTAAVHPTVSALPNTLTPQPRATKDGDRSGPLVVPTPKKDNILVILMSVFVVVGTVAVILAAVFFVKLQKESHLAKKVDYPAFGKAGAPAATASGNGVTMGDKTLAQSAQMFHYQHQKQQMLSLGSHKPEQKVLDGEATSEEEEVGGDFTVYECPGLAPTGEMEVKNPLFDDSALHYQGNHK